MGLFSDNLWSSELQRTYTSIGADVDLISESSLPYPGNPKAPDGTPLKTAGAPCRGIRADADGVISVVSVADAAAGNLGGTLLSFQAGEAQGVQATTILAGDTTVTTFTVYW